MVVRHQIECPGCQARILLRLSVGIDLEQPFFVMCGRCQSILKGKQIIWYEPQPGGRLEMESAKTLDSVEDQECTQTISVHPDLPARRSATSMHDEGGSSFLHNVQLLGPAFPDAMQRMAQFRGFASKEGEAFRRLMGFYGREDWLRFCDEGNKLFGDNWPSPAEEWQYHNLFPALVLAAYGPLLERSPPPSSAEFVNWRR